MKKERIVLESNTFVNLLEYSFKNYANNPALGIVGKNMLTYAEVEVLVNKTAALLKHQGVKVGDKVALWSENLPHWSVAYFAIVSIGAIAVPVLPDFHENEVVHVLQHSEAKAMFISKRYIDMLYDDSHKHSLESVILVDTLELVEELSKHKNKLLEKIEAFLPEHRHRANEDDVSTIIYTSGTTGHSKGVVLTNKNFISNTLATQSIFLLDGDDVLLSILPLAHVFEFTVGLMIAIMHGSRIYYVEKPPTPRVLVDALEIVKPTFMVSVPLVIEKIFKSKILPNFHKNSVISTLYKVPMIRKKLHEIAGKKLYQTFGGRMKLFGIGGAKLSAEVERFLSEAKFPYTIGYGLTETSPLLAGTEPKYAKLGSAGKVVDGIEIKINPETDEILARGPNVMVGYYKDKPRTDEVLDSEGWFNTGDLGYIDNEGYLFINGRSKNVIIGPSGENIYPELIESVINGHELVADSIVYENNGKLYAKINLDYEKLDEIYNSSQKADSTMHENIEKLLEDMRVEVNKGLSSYSKVMKYYEQTEPFVKTATKKIKRYLYI